MTFAVEPYEAVIAEMVPFYADHWREVGPLDDGLPLELDHDRYFQMARLGIIRVATARDTRGALVGYNMAFVGPHLRHKNNLTASVDLVYLAPEWRTGRTGYEFLTFGVEMLRQIGVTKMFFGCPVAHDFSVLLRRLGFRESERIFTKVLA